MASDKAELLFFFFFFSWERSQKSCPPFTRTPTLFIGRANNELIYNPATSARSRADCVTSDLLDNRWSGFVHVLCS